MSTTYHPRMDGQSERTIQTLEDMLRASPVLWAEIGESRLIGPELVQETTDKVSPWKGVIHFGKKGKLAPRYVGAFEIIERIGPVAYRLRLPEELSSVHDTFHVSNLKKCLADANMHVPLDEIKIDKTFRFVVEPVEIIDREVKSLKRSKIPIVKVRWNSKRGPEFTWEREDHMKAKVVNPLNARNPNAAHGACFECSGTDHYKATCPRLNQAPRPGGNHPNQVMAIEGGQGHGNNGNLACGIDFVMGAKEAHQDPNILTGTFTLNNHYAMTLFDSSADYSFVSTTFLPLLDIEPSNLGFSYEIEIANGQLIEISKVIRGYKLEIEGHTFDINLIPFGHRSFDEIVGMDRLSRHKAEIICHEKVVRIPLPNSEMLRVLGERPEEKVRHSKSAKVKEQKLKDIVVVRNFFEVFLDDLSGLPSS
ncbi:putative reverse transcriptase domain-containing protein [Tanacetum coccineum]